MNAKTNKHATSPKLPCDPDHPTQLRIQTDKCRGREDDQHFCCVAYYTFHTRCLLRPCPSERSLCSGSCRVKTWCGFGSICRWTAGGWRVNAPWWRKHWDRAWSQQKKKNKRPFSSPGSTLIDWMMCLHTHLLQGAQFQTQKHRQTPTIWMRLWQSDLGLFQHYQYFIFVLSDVDECLAHNAS